MTKNQFQKELTKLEGLLSSLNKKNKGNNQEYNNHSGGSRKNNKNDYNNDAYNLSGGAENDSRFFKLVSVNGKEVDGGRYELPLKTKTGKPQTRGPKDKASSAFSELCQKNNEKGEIGRAHV